MLAIPAIPCAIPQMCLGRRKCPFQLQRCGCLYVVPSKVHCNRISCGRILHSNPRHLCNSSSEALALLQLCVPRACNSACSSGSPGTASALIARTKMGRPSRRPCLSQRDAHLLRRHFDVCCETTGWHVMLCCASSVTACMFAACQGSDQGLHMSAQAC